MLGKTVHFLAIVLTALVLVPSGAHFFELPGKIDLSQAEYFLVQGIYRGWALFGVVLIGAIAATLLLTLLERRQPLHRTLAGIAFLLMATTLAIFFAGALPANQATENWTLATENWQVLRRQWEYGHAINAMVTFVAFCVLVLQALIPHRR